MDLVTTLHKDNVTSNCVTSTDIPVPNYFYKFTTFQKLLESNLGITNWELLGIIRNDWKLLGIIGNYWELLGITGNYWENHSGLV